MSLVSFIYGLGIAISLTACSLFFVKALYRATGKDREKDIRPLKVQEQLDNRDRLLLNLQELDFDLAMRKISQSDHGEMRSQLRRQLADVVRRLEEMNVDPETSRVTDGLR